MNGIMCGPSVYTFKGWTFEVHSYCGPWPLKKDGELRKRVGRKFWTVWEEWSKLPKQEKDNTRVHRGGCKVF